MWPRTILRAKHHCLQLAANLGGWMLILVAGYNKDARTCKKYGAVTMTKKMILALGLSIAGFGLQGCALAVGAAGVVVADEILENERGGDGLF